MLTSEQRRQLNILGYTDAASRVRVRCFAAKNTPLDEQVKRGIAWQKDEKAIIPLPIEGWLYPNIGQGVFVRLKKKRSDSGEVELDSNGNAIWIESKTYQDGIAYLNGLNTKGYGIYLIPNEGGGADADITRFPALFYECDGISKDEQYQKLRTLEAKLGRTASMVIETRNSLHCYFRLDYDGVLPSTWTQYQQRLIQEQDSDDGIWNPSRLMRLAGFDHQKWNADTKKLEQFPVRLVQENNNIFSLDEFNQLLPGWDESCWNQKHKTSKRVTTDPLERTVKTVDGAFEFVGEHNTIIWAKYQYGYNPVGRGDWITAQDPLIPESEQHLHSIDSLHIHKVTGAIKSHRGSDPKDIYERMREVAEEAIYKELTQLTANPWKEINTPKLDLESLELEGGAIYIACSAKATGKTNALVPVIPKFTNVYSWFSRIALGREESNRIGLDWKDDLKSFPGTIKVGFCADSGYSFPPRHLKNNGLLLVDEADQVLEHTFGDTCNKNGKRPMILAALKAQLDTVISGNGTALFMSADITDKEVSYIQKLAPPGCPVRLIVNHYKPDLGDVYFNESDTPDGMIEQLLQDLESGQPRFVIDDLRTGVRGCKSIAEYIRKRHPEWANEIVEINSDTSGDPAIIGYLKNINIASKTTRLLCCSPSVVSGVSIENGHFTEVYAFLNGVMTVSHGSQAIARVRGAESINVWAAEEGLIYAADRSLFPEQIKGYYKRNYESNCKHLLAFGVEYDPLKDEWDSPHFDLYCKYAAYRNNCMANLRRHLKQRLDDEGYEVFSVTSRPSDVVKAGLEDAWATLEIKHAHDVAAANILTDTQLQALENTTLTPEQKLDVEKTYLLKAFGQELIDNTVFEHGSGEVLTGFAAMVLKDQRGEYRKQLEAFHLLITDPGTAIAKDLKAEQRQLEHGAGRFAGDVRWNTRQRKAREFLGLHNFLNPESWYGPADFAALAEKAKKHLGRVKDALGFAVGLMTAGQVFGELMGQLGLELNKKWATDRTKSGRRYKLRQINPDSWRYAQMYVTYRESLFTQDSKSPEPDESQPETSSNADHPSVNYLSKRLGGGDQGLSHTGHEIEVVSRSCFLPDISRLPDAQNQVNLDALAATLHHKVEDTTASPSIQARAVEILTRAGDWLRGYFYVGRKADRHQLADSTGYRGIFVDANEFRFVEEVAA